MFLCDFLRRRSSERLCSYIPVVALVCLFTVMALSARSRMVTTARQERLASYLQQVNKERLIIMDTGSCLDG